MERAEKVKELERLVEAEMRNSSTRQEEFEILKAMLEATLTESSNFKQEIEAMKLKREAERAGRIRAEAALRKTLVSSSTNGEALREGEGDGGGAKRGYMMREIGCLDSCFRRRFGTPRQGAVVRGGRAILRMYER